MKKIQKRIKNHELALALYNLENSDAIYLAGLIADDTKMTREDLQAWADNANWHMLSEYIVAWVATKSIVGISWHWSGLHQIKKYRSRRLDYPNRLGNIKTKYRT